ncbi:MULTISPECIES: phage major tail protein, TP901-1 family [unclassified Oceanobacillus]|uniref:phage major tail protein, TP901-1 family n=1 Tax=unclassified Oceanobacillus TaxID=2630292 RepID=UPI001BE670C0|nr:MULTISPECIES: phage major tail protein, TP901-1 family [unclassified Oceanobacillus]MBT2599085.1 phage major tail protein, TP901-1 family [Oceanobacillus sp. ISL-74]MBT2652003.1 phage major tail protein, TP901-1 family [Oceanobacillus sp. ISL-73]
MRQNGRDTILLVQPVDTTIGNGALVVAEQTESTYSIENELVDEQSKMGRILAYGPNSESLELTSYGVKGDPGQEAIINAIEQKKKLKVWEVDLIPNDEGTYDARFAYCLVESAEKSSPSDNFIEVNSTLQVEGQSVKGTLDELPDGITNANSYEFEQPGETGEAEAPAG